MAVHGQVGRASDRSAYDSAQNLEVEFEAGFVCRFLGAHTFTS